MAKMAMTEPKVRKEYLEQMEPKVHKEYLVQSELLAQRALMAQMVDLVFKVSQVPKVHKESKV
jgi:hypothetical protein